MSLIPYSIEGWGSGLTQNKKSFALKNTEFPELSNAYCWRERIIKREGLKIAGRYRRLFLAESLGNTVAATLTYTFNTLYSSLTPPITGEPNAQIEPGSVVITVAAPDAATFTDQGNGLFNVTGGGVIAGSSINYATGVIVIVLTAAAGGAAITIDFNYFPMLPSMGIIIRERIGINDEQTVFFDTKYSYIYDGSTFQEFNAPLNPTLIPPRWTGTDSDFFWGTNYRGVEPQDRLLFVTNFVIDISGAGSKDPIRYTDGATWTDFTPIVGSESQDDVFPDYDGVLPSYSGTLTKLPIIPGTVVITVETVPPLVFRDTPKNNTLVSSGANSGTINYSNGNFQLFFSPAVAFANYGVDAQYNWGTAFLQQARILLPYYGRLIALNVWEGTDINTSSNIFNRCRFSQVGNPLQKDAWRSDIFGKGGFIDAPVNEEIISAIYYKNTLIVFFEESTWQLRYNGDYGLPFIWERISSDYGSESTFSTILFDTGVLGVGDKAIVSSSGNNIERIDLDIPDKVFSFNNQQDGVKRVHGIRDYQKELVFWTYSEGTDNRKFPNYSLLYNYRNNSWATFRNNVTTYGYLKAPADILWDSTAVTWDDPVSWSEIPEENFPLVISGNQQGFVHLYGYANAKVSSTSLIDALDQESLAITAINLAASPIVLTVPDHNLETTEVIYIVGLKFLNATKTTIATTDLNDNFYEVTRIDNNTFSISKYDLLSNSYGTPFSFTPNTDSVYMGGGLLALLPVMSIRTKDLNPFEKKGISTKLAYVDFLMDAQSNAAFTVKLYVNSRVGPKNEANIFVNSQNTSESLTSFGNIVGASKANPGIITTQKPHGLANGDTVKISQVVGMIELNTANDFVIKTLSATTFSINQDTTGFTTYVSGGNFIQTNHPFYIPSSNYAWQRYYAGCNGQFIAVNLTYNDELMNQLATHQQLMVLNSIKMWIKEGSKSIF